MVVCHRIVQPYRSESAIRFGSADVGDSSALAPQQYHSTGVVQTVDTAAFLTIYANYDKL